MSYSEKGDRIHLDLSREQYGELMLAMGILAGEAARYGDNASFWRRMRLANAINEGNPHWTPYEIPEGAQ